MIVAILVAPLSALVATSLVSAYGVPLSPDTVTFDNYVEVLLRQQVTIRAFRNSFFLALSASLILMAIALPLAYFIVWRRNWVLTILNLAAELPYALPGVVLAIAMILDLHRAAAGDRHQLLQHRSGSSSSPIWRASSRWRCARWSAPCTRPTAAWRRRRA